MEDFKLPRSSYEEINRIIMAYGRGNGKEVSLDDIVKSTGINRSVVSGNNGFLASVNIIEGGNKKVITLVGSELATAVSLNYSEQISKAWKQIIEENEFLTKIVSAVEIRRGMEVSQLVTHIIFSSGQQSTKNNTTGARAIIDILLASDVVREQDGKIVPVASPTPPLSKQEPKDATNLEDKKEYRKPSQEEQFKEAQVNFNVNLVINANPDQLNGIGEKIRLLFEELKKDELSGEALVSDS